MNYRTVNYHLTLYEHHLFYINDNGVQKIKIKPNELCD